MKAAVADEEDDPGNRGESLAAVRARQMAAMRELLNSPLVQDDLRWVGHPPRILLDDLGGEAPQPPETIAE